MARTLSGFGFLGTHTIAFTPNILDASAMDWPWFPVEAVTTPRRLSVCAQLADEVYPSPDLEGASRLVILVLDVHLDAYRLRERAVLTQRRLRQIGLYPLPGCQNILEGGLVHSTHYNP